MLARDVVSQFPFSLLGREPPARVVGYWGALILAPFIVGAVGMAAGRCTW
jgi:hypothetical protein